MFKRYADPNHYLFAIPIGRYVWMRLWDQTTDMLTPHKLCRKHLVITYRSDTLPTHRGCGMREFRFRIGTHYI